MRSFLLFFTIVFSVYALANYYILIRGWQALPDVKWLRVAYVSLFLLLAASFFSGRILERLWLGRLSEILVWTGSFWLAAMLYFILILVAVDLFRLMAGFWPESPKPPVSTPLITETILRLRPYTMAGVIAGVALLIGAGYINARHPVVRELSLNIERQQGPLREIRAVVMSDIHLGTIISNERFSKIIDRVDALKPDIILLPGDILDEDLEPLIRQNTGEVLRKLQAPLGVYGIMGNHEHIGGASAAWKYLQEHGIIMLRDTVVRVADSFYLIGREDRDKPRFSQSKRKELKDLIALSDQAFPLILLDHQPYYLEKAAALGIDLQLSGHTHHGQLWPLNLVTRAIFTLSRGYAQIDGMHAYVSNGVGTWGPPVRIGNRPEIVLLHIRFGPA